MWLGSLNLWHYLRVLGAPPVAWSVIFTIAALVFTAAVLLFRALLLRGAVWSALITLPAGWVVYEYVRNITSSGGTAGSFAYSQLSFLPFLQLAALTGPWGMTFFLLLFSTVLAIGWHLRSIAPKKAAQVLIVGVGSVVLMLVFGVVRLAMPLRAPQVRVGLSHRTREAMCSWQDREASTERLFGDYAAAAETLTNRGAQVIVMPEKLGTVEGRAITSTDAIFQTLADKTGTTIVAGMVDPPLPSNTTRHVYIRPEDLQRSMTSATCCPRWNRCSLRERRLRCCHGLPEPGESPSARTWTSPHLTALR